MSRNMGMDTGRTPTGRSGRGMDAIVVRDAGDAP